MAPRLLLVLALAACRPGSTPTAPGATPATPAPGAATPDTPPTLRLPPGFTPTRYRARLAIDPQSPTFAGTIEIDGTLAAPTTTVWLNADQLRITKATARTAAKTVPVDPLVLDHDFVGLRAALPAGAVTFTLAYEGTFETQDSWGAFVQSAGADRYVFTQFQPDGARRVFPCVDEPWSKVPWQLDLETPPGAVALANTPVARASNGVTSFAESEPLPAYLVAFAVGPFELVDAGATSQGAPIRIAALRGRAADAAWAAEVTPKIVAILEDWFGTPYPYAKLDQVAIPTTVGFGAMENAGLVSYAADLLLLDPDRAGEDARRDLVVTAAHELAHQWFGNLVTPAWWDDLWLSEAFATWMEDKVMSAFSPAWGSRIPAVTQRDDALAADGLLTARRLRNPITHPDDITTAFDPITYEKGAAVIRMFEAWVGADAFRDGVRRFLADHARGTATSDDFLAALDAASDRDVTPAFRAFLDEPGAPRVAAELRCDKKQPPVITLTQTRWVPRGTPPPSRWTIPVCIAHGTVKTRQTTCTVLAAETAEVTLDGKCPAWFFPNAGGHGYYRIALTADTLDDLVDDGWKQLPPHERVLLAGDVRAATLRGDLDLGAELALVPRLVKDGSRAALEVAVTIAGDALAVADDTTRPALAAWVKDTFGRRARKLGFLPDEGDGYARERARAAIVPLAAEVGGEARLLERAKELSRTWRELPDSARVPVLRTAVLHDDKLRVELQEVAVAPRDAREAADAFAALSAIVDPTDAGEALAVLLDPAVDLAHGRQLLLGLADDPRTQPIAEAFLRENLSTLLPRMPGGVAAELVHVATAACDAARRDEIASWARATFEPLDGGTRVVAQALEEMDVCIARRAALAPQLAAWLDARR